MAPWYTLDSPTPSGDQAQYTATGPDNWTALRQRLLGMTDEQLKKWYEQEVAASTPPPSSGGTAPKPATPAPSTDATGVIPDYLLSMFNQYGLKELASWYIKSVQSGMTDAEIAEAIYDQPEYKKRFPAMAALRAKGHALSEAEYLSVEKSYRDSMAAYGLAGSVYDSQATFTRLMESEVSVRELEERLSDAKMVVDSTDPNIKNALASNYGMTYGDLMTYALDPKGMGKEHVDRLARSATLQGIAQSFSLQLNKVYSEQLAMDSAFNNATEADYRSALSDVAGVASTQGRLGGIEGTKVTDADVADAVIKKDAKKLLASQRRAQREQARFAGSSGVSAATLRRGSL